jgi:MATE family multidrug resistance protein
MMTSTQLSRFLDTYKNHYKALVSLGLPIVIGQIGVIILGFADTLMIGHHSTAELGAASFVNNVFNLAIIFSTGFSYGLTPIVGGLFGTSQYAPAGQALRNSLLANSLVAFLITLCMSVLYWNVESLGQPEELIPLIKPYYLVLLASLVFVMLFNCFKQFTDGITDTRTAMWILLGGNVLNIFGNYLLIYGKCGLPELGLLGAGISTLFSRMVMVVVFVCIFLRSSRFVRYKVGFLRMGWSKAMFCRLNGLGWPIAFQMGMETASFSLSAIMIGWLGTIALASHQVMLAISQFTFMMYYGMGAAVAVRVSNFNGQRDIVNVRRAAYAGFHMMMALGAVLSLIVFLFRNQLGSWFTDSPEVVTMVTSLIVPFLIYQFGDGLQITFANALRGISDVKPMMLIAFIAYFVISLPVGYLCGFVLDWGIVGVWMAFPFGLTSAGWMLWWRFRSMTQSVSLY